MADVRTIKVVIDAKQAQADLNTVQANIQRMSSAYQGVTQSITQAAGASQTMASSTAAVGDNAAKGAKGLDSAAEAAKKLTGHSTAARREILVLAHEAATGQWNSFAGSLLVLGERTDALGKVMGVVNKIPAPLRIGLVGLAAAAGVVGAAFYQASKEAHEFNDALLLTNNYAGLSGGSLGTMAADLQKFASVGVGAAKDAITELTKTGAFSGQQIKDLGPVVADFSKLSGQNIAKVVQDFAKLAGEPYKVAKQLDDSMHIMTASELERIKVMDESGNKAEALNTVIAALVTRNAELNANLQAQRGFWDNLGQSMGDAWSHFKNWAGGAGVAAGADNLAKIQKQIADLELSKSTAIQYGEDAKAIEEKIAALKKMQNVLMQAKEREANNQAPTGPGKNDPSYLQLQQQGKDAMSFLRPYTEATVSIDEKIARFQKAWDVAKKANQEAAALGREPLNATFNDANYNKALQAFIERNKNPIDEQRQKQAYLNGISNLDEYIKDAQQKYQYYNTMLAAEVMSGNKTEKQALDESHQLKADDIKAEIEYTQKKLELAAARAKAHPGDEEANNQLREYTRQIKALQESNNINDAQWAANKAKMQKDVAAIYDHMMLDEKKWMEGNARSFNNDTAKEFMTANEAAKFEEAAAATDHYREARDRLLESYKQKNMTGSAEEQKALADLGALEQSEADAAKARWDKRLEAQKDWTNGARASLKQYAEDAQNVAKTTKTAMDGILGSMEDHLTDFFSKGKFGFKDFVNDINKELARANAKAITGMISSFGADLMGSGKASGGRVEAGKTVPVGEDGMELFTPSTDGYIIPNHVLSQSGAVTNNSGTTVSFGDINIGAGNNVTKADLEHSLRGLEKTVSIALANRTRHNGA